MEEKSIDQLAAAAETYRALGLKPLPLDGKNPGPLWLVGNWQHRAFDEEAIRRCLTSAESPAIGIQMGPKPFASGFVDFEYDSPAQKAKLDELFGGNMGDGPAFKSRKGEHFLFAWNVRLEAIGKAVVKIDCGPGDDGLKVRIGAAAKGAQSAFPPSTGKAWLPGREYGQCDLPDIPEAVIAALLALGVKRKATTGKARVATDGARKIANALEAMLRHAPKPEEGDGSTRLLLLCRCAVEHDLSDIAAIAAIRKCERKYPFKGRTYDDADIAERLRSAEERTVRGSAKVFRKADDIGNGQRFADRHSANVRYSNAWKKWLVWRGGRWQIDDMGYVQAKAKETSRAIYAEAKAVTSERREAMRKWAKTSASRDKLSAMLYLAQSEPPIPVDYKSLDAHPWLFNCKNGTIDLRTGELREHRREDLLTKRCPLVYPESYVKPPLWLAFLDRIFAGNVELIRFLQRLMGYSLVGEVSEHILPIFHGDGSNGKSVLTLTWLGMMGNEYATSTSKEFLMLTKSERHATELASLYGQRLVVSAETDEGARLNEARVKHLTGGNLIKARRMREDEWEFRPSHTLILETNHRPYIVGTDHGIWRRVLLVFFGVKIPDEEQDKQLGNKLQAEWPMILRWAVRGCMDWQADGLKPPKEVELASAEYRDASDSFGEFLDECCIVAPGKTAPAEEFYSRYARWVKARGGQPQSMRRIGERLSPKFDKKRTKRGFVYVGIGLAWDAFEEFSDVDESEDFDD